ALLAWRRSMGLAILCHGDAAWRRSSAVPRSPHEPRSALDPPAGLPRRLERALREGLAHRAAGYVDQFGEGPVHLEDEEDGARKGERADDQGRDGRGVRRREEAEAHEDDCEPEDENQEKRLRDRPALLHLEEPVGPREVGADAQSPSLKPALAVVAGRECTEA